MWGEMWEGRGDVKTVFRAADGRWEVWVEDWEESKKARKQESTGGKVL